MPRVKRTPSSLSSAKPAKKRKSVGIKKEHHLNVKVGTSDHPYGLGSIVITLNDEISYHLIPDAFVLEYDLDVCNWYVRWKGESDALEKRVVAICKAPFDVLEGLSVIDIFHFTVNFHLHPGDNVIQIFFDTSTFISLSDPSEPFFNYNKKKMLELLMFFLKIEFKEYEEVEFHEGEYENMYGIFSNHFDTDRPSVPVTLEFFIPKLRLYQAQAVHWMLQRESAKSYCSDDDHVLYSTIDTLDKKKLHFHKYGGFFVSKKFVPEDLCKGGILADEMGLGKTLEVLACILLNPRKDLPVLNENSNDDHISKSSNEKDSALKDMTDMKDENLKSCICGHSKQYIIPELGFKCKECNVYYHYKCLYKYAETYSSSDEIVCPFCCVNKSELLPSKTTLIVSPASIIQQWKEEIQRHVKENVLKVFMYEGIEHQKFVEPSYLVSHDIVLISYETLRKELNHVDLPHGENQKSFRRPKKFMALPSPLCRIEFWRACLDEAQMVESVSSKISKMTGKLRCINRWCVTGTPIKKSIDDLFGLFMFLEVKPYKEKIWWNEVLWKPYINGDTSNLCSVLKTIGWRTTKQQVSDQIQIPLLQEQIHKLEFSALETVFYENQLHYWRNRFLENITKFDTLDIKLTAVNRTILSKVILPLRYLQLRCSLCVVRNGEARRLTIPPTELLSHLMKNAKIECEDAHRNLIMALNGLAGIYAVQEDYQNAIGTYEKALKSIEDNERYCRTDVTQRIHSSFHLSKLLSLCEKEGRNIESKLVSSALDEKVKELTANFMQQGKTAVLCCKNVVDKYNDEITAIKEKFKLKNSVYLTSSWWGYIFENLKNGKDELLQKIKDALNNAPGKIYVRNISNNRIREMSMIGAFYEINKLTHSLYNSREEVKHLVESLSKEPDQKLIDHAILCHLRPPPNLNSPKCLICHADIQIKSYEAKLFRYEEVTHENPVEEAEEEDATSNVCFSISRRGTNADADLEIMLKAILRFIRQKGLEWQDCIEDGLNELKLFETLKREFKSLKNLWMRCADYISCKDTLEMAKIASRLYVDGEEPKVPPIPYLLYPHEVVSQKIRLQNDVISYDDFFKKKLGRFFYLQNIEKSEDKDDQFDKTCPVCKETFENAWSVLQCGHRLCFRCVDRLYHSSFTTISNNNLAGVSCPICRQFTIHSQIYVVDKNKADERKEIKGNHSTKTAAIVKLLCEINEQNPRTKTLVFSTFNDVLVMLQKAIEENRIRCLNFSDKSQCKDPLKIFKESEDYNVLLMPLSFRCSGLNITEASNIILVEPVIDVSQHLQAIGRIHRIGQTKQTTVHRFYVSRSIEEKIYGMQKFSYSDSHQLKEFTLQSISDIFLSS